MTSTPTEIAVIRSWHDALNAGDLERFVALHAEDVEFAGPRGSSHGAALLRDWAERAGIQMEPERWFARGDAVVVTQRARWRDAETGEWGEPITIGAAFVIQDGLVQRIARFDTVAGALASVGLSDADEATPSEHVQAWKE